uniref:Proproteinase E-like n=1 Tax=Myripristis murdjan TaxID=586833 RepID=A0A667YBA3_9TELE
MFILCCVVLVFGCGTPTFKPNTNRVVNGEDARPHSWPWQISLQVKHGSRFHHTCGGTLIGPRWVLTAGHCIWCLKLKHHDMSQQEGTEQIRDVLRIVVHPNWDIDHVGDGNDLALLKLDKSPIMNDNVGLACLPEAGEIPAHGAPCYISGWGNLYTHGPMPDKLQQALLPVVEYSVCSRSDWWGINVKRTMICAPKQSICFCYSQITCHEQGQGDSGGPLNCMGQDGKWYVQGVTSFVSSRTCNEVKKPTVFTRTSAFIKWIDDVS